MKVFLIKLLCAVVFVQLTTGSEIDKTEAEVEMWASSDPNMANPSVENFYLNPYALKNLSSMDLHEFAGKKDKMQEEFIQYLVEQITLTEENEAIPGQRVCLPLILRDKNDLIHPSFNYHNFIFNTVRQITAGTFVQNLFKEDETVVPIPKYHRVVNYNSDKDYFIDMGPDFTLGDSSFTIAATIRFRGNTSRGARVLSKRDRNHDGWEVVVPSYYGKQVSFYASAVPGHLDYGQTFIPEDEWTVIGLVFDRETYPGDIVKVTSYVDGVKDGPSTVLNFKGAKLKSVANLTVGLGRREDGRVAAARIDYHEPPDQWKRYSHQFFGDIKEFSIWHKALKRQHMRKHAFPQLRKLRPKKPKSTCRKGWKALDCVCYKVFNQIASFDDAREVCQTFDGGILALPKTDRIQVFLEVMMQEYRASAFWIGLNDQKVENEYSWSDGTVFNWRKDYHRFVKGKPDKTYKTEDCFEEKKAANEFIWNDHHCQKLNAFICQIPDTKCTLT